MNNENQTKQSSGLPSRPLNCSTDAVWVDADAVKLHKRIGRMEFAIELAISCIENNTCYTDGRLKELLESSLKEVG